jgi:hypothetical protein
MLPPTCVLLLRVFIRLLHHSIVRRSAAVKKVTKYSTNQTRIDTEQFQSVPVQVHSTILVYDTRSIVKQFLLMFLFVVQNK